jgi:hypothetical protein
VPDGQPEIASRVTVIGLAEPGLKVPRYPGAELILLANWQEELLQLRKVMVEMQYTPLRVSVFAAQALPL